jgi:hypothetical protein
MHRPGKVALVTWNARCKECDSKYFRLTLNNDDCIYINCDDCGWLITTADDLNAEPH